MYNCLSFAGFSAEKFKRKKLCIFKQTKQFLKTHTHTHTHTHTNGVKKCQLKSYFHTVLFGDNFTGRLYEPILELR